MIDTVDTIGADADNIPFDFWKSRLVLGYVTGPTDIVWSMVERSRFPHWVGIDQSANPSTGASVARVGDIEQGAMTIPTFVQWAEKRHRGGESSTGYLSEALLVAARLAVKDAGIPGVTYGVANWNLTRAQAIARLGGDVVWVQYASPSSDPNMQLPGSHMTLKEANCDLGVAVDGWPSFHPDGPPPSVKQDADRAIVTHDVDEGWSIAPAPLGKDS